MTAYPIDHADPVDALHKPIAETAHRYSQAGLCVLPAKRIEKRPAVGRWKQYRDRMPTTAEVSAWFANGPDALCIVCGKASDGTEILDFDHNAERFDAWCQKVRHAAPGLLERLVIQSTQNDGRHVGYRFEGELPGNIKLASGLRDGELVTLIETRSEGGLFLCAPTDGYELLQGDFTHLPVLTAEERDILLRCGRELDEDAPRGHTLAPVGRPCAPGSTGRPGDDYNARGDLSRVLESCGWTLLRQDDQNQYWRRPGKTDGQSATFNGEHFYVFTSNAPPLEPDQAYRPFAVYAMLEHGGDFEAATRALSQQGYGDAPAPQLSGVDLSGLLGWADEIEAADDRVPDPGPIPDELFDVPGFVREVMDFCLATAPYPNRGLAFCGAMALQSFLAGRKVAEPGDLRPNIYLLALAGSGAGKDHPRKLNAKVLFEAGLIQCIGDKFASGEGIQDAMAQEPCMLFQNDEMDSVLRQINRDREGTRESIPATLLTMYTTAGSVFPLRRKAGKEQAGIIDQPHLTLFGTATPKFFYQSLSEQMLTNGFFARLMIVDIGNRGDGQRAGSLRNLPDRIAETAQWWAEFSPGTSSGRANLLSFHPEPAVAPMVEEAASLMDDFRLVTEREYRDGEQRDDEVWKAVWARGYENAAKLALLWACSADHENPVIDLPAVEWAIRFADHQIRRQLFLASEHVYGNEFEDLCKQLIRVLREWQVRNGDAWMPFWRVSRKLKWSPKVHVDVRQALVDSREIEFQEVTTGGRPSRQYRLSSTSCSAALKKA